MNRRGFLAAVTGAGLASIAGCASLTGGSGSDGPYKSVVRDNVRATETEDLALLKDTLHPESPIYDQTIEQSKQIWAAYDLQIEIEELEVTERPSTATESSIGANAMQMQTGGEDCDTSRAQAFQVSQGGDCTREARVRFVQVTRVEGESEFRENRIEGVHILRPTESDWKLWTTDTRTTEYL